MVIDSLAAASSKQVVMTMCRVSGRLLKFKNLSRGKRQRQVSARGVPMTVDMHFGGFTPLHDPEG